MSTRSSRFVAAVVAVVALGLGPVGPAAAAGPEDVEVDITVSILTPQPALPTDPGGVTVQVVARVESCPDGCSLVRYGTYRFSDFREDLAEHPPAAGPVTLTHTERYEAGVFDRFEQYDVRSTASYDPIGLVTHPLGAVWDQERFAYDATWSVDADLGSTGHLIRRSSTRGATAAFTVADDLPAGVEGQVGLVSARGPNNGVVSIRTSGGGDPVVVDLRASRWTSRQVVAVVPVQPGDVVTVQNVTPAGRAGSDVHVDGVVVNYADGVGQRVGAPRDTTRPGLAVDFVVGQELPVAVTSARTRITARTLGCPEGCSVTAGNEWGVPPRELDRWVSPASAGIQTRVVPWTAPRSDVSGPFTLSTARGRYETPELLLRYVPERQLERSHGWTNRADRGSVDGSFARTSTRGAGMTFRPSTEVDGQTVGVVAARGPRGGVMGVYADGKLTSTVDLYAPTWQPRRVVASTYVPAQARITLLNRTPGARANADVHVDGLVLLQDVTCWSC